jgi:hypothetical protein
MSLFPRNTVELHHLVEPKAFRRFSYSLPETAIVTGVLLRVFRSLVFTHGSNNWMYVGGMLALGAVVLLGMTTAHLANFPLHRWVWRVPLFVLVEVTAEMVTSALLIVLGREPNGATSAHWDDWLALASGTLVVRSVAIIVWALLLAGVVQIVRTQLAREEPDDPAGVSR